MLEYFSVAIKAMGSVAGCSDQLLGSRRFKKKEAKNDKGKESRNNRKI